MLTMDITATARIISEFAHKAATFDRVRNNDGDMSHASCYAMSLRKLVEIFELEIHRLGYKGSSYNLPHEETIRPLAEFLEDSGFEVAEDLVNTLLTERETQPEKE